jgi:hypothetical protein
MRQSVSKPRYAEKSCYREIGGEEKNKHVSYSLTK